MAHAGPRIYKRGRYWIIDARPYGGKRESLRSPLHPDWPYSGERTEDEDIARKWSWDYVAYYRDGVRRRQLGLPPRPRKLGDAYKAFLEHRAGTVAENTRVGDRTARTHLLANFTADTYTDRITTDALQKMVNARLAEGYKPGSMQSLMTSLSAFFSWIGGGNPVEGVVLPKVQGPEIRVWSEPEVLEIYDAADYVDSHRTERNWPSAVLVVSAFLNTGVRQQEGFALETGAVNEASSSLRVYRQLNRTGQRFVDLKGRLARTTFILAEFWDFWHYKPDTFLLLGRSDGRMLGHRSQKNLLQRVLDGSRLYEAGTGFHAFRHTYARRYLEGGGSLGELQVFLGHTMSRTTEGRYKHFKDSVALKLAHERFDMDRLRA